MTVSRKVPCNNVDDRNMIRYQHYFLGLLETQKNRGRGIHDIKNELKYGVVHIKKSEEKVVKFSQFDIMMHILDW